MGFKYLLKEKRKTYLTKSREEEMEKALNECLKFSDEKFRKEQIKIPILDIGASEGMTYKIFFKNFKEEVFYLATELNRELARELRKEYKELDVILCAAYNLPFRENCVNAMCLNVANWKPINQKELLKEIVRVSKYKCAFSLYKEIFQEGRERFKEELIPTENEVKEILNKWVNKGYAKEEGLFKDKNGILTLYIINALQIKNLKTEKRKII